jgi:hypothetical protein
MAHHHQYCLTDQEDKIIVCFCNSLYDYSHPVNIHIGEGYAKSLLHVTKCKDVGKHFTTLFINDHPELAATLIQCLDNRRAAGSDPEIITDFFRKVIILHYK